MFDTAYFCFQYEKSGRSRFNYAFFSTNFDLQLKNEALTLREDLSNTLAAVYPNLNSKIIDGMKIYVCGRNPIDEDKYLIMLYISKSKNKEGDDSYFVNLEYGPINYVDPNSDF